MDNELHAVPTLQVENDSFIVTEWRFAPGATTGWHRHGHDYVVVPLTSGRLEATTADGVVVAELTAGVAYSRPEGVEHDIRNINDHEFVFVEVERK